MDAVSCEPFSPLVTAKFTANSRYFPHFAPAPVAARLDSPAVYGEKQMIAHFKMQGILFWLTGNRIDAINLTLRASMILVNANRLHFAHHRQEPMALLTK